MVKFFVDLHADGDTYGPGQCPRETVAKSEDEGKVPLSFQLTKDHYGKSFLAIALTNTELYSLTTFIKYVAVFRKHHLQVKTNNSCWLNLSYVHKSTYLAEAVYSGFLQQSRLLLRNDTTLSWTRTICKEAQKWDDDDKGLDTFDLCLRHPITVLRKESILSASREWAWIYRCCTVRKDQQIRCQEDLCGNSFLLLAHVLVDIFFVLAFTVVFPLLPLKIMSVMLQQVLEPFALRQNRPAPDDDDTYEMLDRPRGQSVWERQKVDSHPFLVMKGDFRLDASLPACFTATHVWPYLGVVFSRKTMGAASLICYMLAFIVWPFVQYFYIDTPFLHNEDTTERCHHPQETTKTAVYLTGNALLLLLPFIHLMGHTVYEQSRSSDRNALPEAEQTHRSDRHVQWELLKDMVDGKLQPQPLAQLTSIGGLTVQHVLVTIFIEYPASVKRYTALIFKRGQRSTRGMCVVAALRATLAFPFLAVCLLVVAAARVSMCFLLDITRFFIRMLQWVPLFRLSNAVVFAIWGPLLGLNCSIFVLALSLALLWPLSVAQRMVCQQILHYGLVTTIGLVLNYSTEVIVWGSIISTLVIEAQHAHRKLYAPLLSLKTQVVCVALECQGDRQEASLRKHLGQCLGEENGTQDIAVPALAKSSPHEKEDILLRQAAALTFLEMSGSLISGENFKPNLEFEKCPYSWCSGWRSSFDTALARLDSTLMYTGKQERPMPVADYRGYARWLSNSDIAAEIANTADDIPMTDLCNNGYQVCVAEREKVLKAYMRERVVRGIKKIIVVAILLVAVLCVLLEFDLFWENQSQLMRLMPLLIPIVDFIHTVQQRPQAMCGVKRTNIKISRLFEKNLTLLKT